MQRDPRTSPSMMGYRTHASTGSQDMPNNSQPIAEDGELFATHIGGAATLEGVMMRGRDHWAVAVRCEDGSIYTEEHDLPAPESRPAWMKLPLVRGCVSLVSSMSLSYKAMEIAAEHAFEEEGSEAAQAEGTPNVEVLPGETASAETASTAGATESSSAGGTNASSASSDAPAWQFILSIALGLALGMGLFVALPVGVANLLMGPLTSNNTIVWNLCEALLRIVVLIAYVGGIGFLPDMARLYGYHGAEHQSIHCFEHGLPLTPENAAKFSRIHVRCSTAFLVMTVMVAIVVHTLVPVGAWADGLGLVGIPRSLFVFASRIAMLPLVAGLSYEVTVKWAGSHPDNPLVKIALWPGLMMQKLTTRTADEGMLECAIAALRLVDEHEKRAGSSTE